MDRIFCSEVPREAYRLTGVKKLAMRSFHAVYNGGTERVNRTMAQILSCFVKEQLDDWDEPLPRVQFLYDNNSVSAATDSAPSATHSRCLLQLPSAVFKHGHLAGHRTITVSHLPSSNTKLLDLFRWRSRYNIRDWTWLHNPEDRLRQWGCISRYV